MINFLRRLRQDDGVGMVLALSVSFIVFALGATWYAMSIHELDEVTADRNRTQALNAAEAGAREVMARLANDEAFRDEAETPAGASLGITGGLCDVAALGTSGEYWVRVTGLGDLRYEITSWGWAPNRQSRQVSQQALQLDVELIPLGGFKDALFAAGGGIVGSNRKEIYGTAYSGNDLTLGNFTRLYQNDVPYQGDGSLSVYGDLNIPNGSNVEIRGNVNVQGEVRDNSGSTYLSSIFIRSDDTVSSFFDTYFNKAIVVGEVQYDLNGAMAAGTSFKGTAPNVLAVTTLDPVANPVPQIPLPLFTLNAAREAQYVADGWSVTHHVSAAAMQAYINGNKNNLGGIHIIDGANGGTLEFKQTTFTDHFMVIGRPNPAVGGSTGSLVVKGTPSAGGTPGGEPATVVIVVDDTAGVLTMGQNFQSIPEEVHHLIFSTGDIDSANQTTVYGAVYGERDLSNNRLEIHFRPPEESLIEGSFVFDPALADKFIPSPGLWNDIGGNEVDLTTFCIP